MKLTKRKVLGGCAGVLGFAAFGHVVNPDHEVEFDPERDEVGPEEWLEQNSGREETAVNSYREGANLIGDEEYALAKPHMEDAQEEYRSLFLDVSERDGEVFDKIARYYNLMKAASGSAVQACDSALRKDTNDANQYMETAVNQHNEAQQVRDEIRDSL